MWTLKISSFFVCYILITHTDGTSSADTDDLEIYPLSPTLKYTIREGQNMSWFCVSREQGEVWWTRNNDILQSTVHRQISNLVIGQAKVEDGGSYTCRAKSANGNSYNKTIILLVLGPGKIRPDEGVIAKSGSSASLTCKLEGHSLSGFQWEKIGEPHKTQSLKDQTEVSTPISNYVTMTLKFPTVSDKDNGTYVCRVSDYNNTSIFSERVLVVTNIPEIKILSVKAVGEGKAYLNWTVNNHNDRVINYHIDYQESTNGTWQSQSEIIDPENSSFIISGLETGIGYRFRIFANNSYGNSMPDTFPNWITLSDKEFSFVPTIEMSKKANGSITIDIASPPTDLKDYDFYYNITVSHGANIIATHYSAVNARSDIIENLDPETHYNVRIAACNYYTKKCSQWSAWTSDDYIANISPGLHTSGVNMVVVNSVLLYLAVKHLFT